MRYTAFFTAKKVFKTFFIDYLIALDLTQHLEL
ncbi:hypothetical protein BN8_06088 [Fibrisoma limi BUZ 3]|uniref:Uncharacterized protein n=1 Tax=Fibrisoma limi BUZ 3 TaxID=1185876 RepID=I2GS27_9BACT|nr:hypothetical protein BN8_06088 [Fibrisoma limi BUZ 3]